MLFHLLLKMLVFCQKFRPRLRSMAKDWARRRNLFIARILTISKMIFTMMWRLLRKKLKSNDLML